MDHRTLGKLQEELDRALGVWLRGAATTEETLRRLLACIDPGGRSVAILVRDADGDEPAVIGALRPDLVRHLARDAARHGRLLLSSPQELAHALPPDLRHGVGWVAIEPLDDSSGACVALGPARPAPELLLALPALAQAVLSMVAHAAATQDLLELRHEMNNTLSGVTGNLSFAVELVNEAREAETNDVAASRLDELKVSLLHASASATSLGRRARALLPEGPRDQSSFGPRGSTLRRSSETRSR
jgi:hypothetical protein